MNNSRSFFRPWLKGSSSAFFMDSTTASGDSWPRAFLLTRVFQFSRISRFSVESSSLISEIRGLISLFASILWANSSAVPNRSLASVNSSITPIFSASLAPTWRPEVIMSSAFSRPAIRGRRWVPPAPGIRPRLTSGNPTRLLSSAMR